MKLRAHHHILMGTSLREAMKKYDKFIGDVLAPFEQSLGMKFNKFDKPEDPKFVEPKKKNLKRKLKVAERKQAKIKKTPEAAREAHWKNAMSKAQGNKVDDDPNIIKKVIKKKEAAKKKHKKAWTDRTQRLKEAKGIQEKKKKERIQKAKAKSKTKSKSKAKPKSSKPKKNR